MNMFRSKNKNREIRVARWLLSHMDPAELQRLLLREDVPSEIWSLLEGQDDESGLAEPVTGESPYN